ncbi:MAG: hypothetical protein K8S27_11360 [Candidatus Omnitrophica bacterium]|nr:hypothetical protein [Candidatus Omnitrophota bacterium]
MPVGECNLRPEGDERKLAQKLIKCHGHARGYLLKKASRLPLDIKRESFTIIGSRSHMSKETEEYIEEQKKIHGKVEVLSAGSSLKLCLVAEGKADASPRFAPTMEWDTAAGHAIVEEVGARVVNTKTNNQLDYNKDVLVNEWFLAR